MFILNILDFNDSEAEQTPFYINSPTSRPTGYNTTLYPIAVDLYLDPECRYTISATNSFGQTASRIFLQFSHWIPAHLVAILLLAFRYQIKITPEKEIFKCSPLNVALMAGQTFFIITGKANASVIYGFSRINVKIVFFPHHFSASRLAVHVIKWSKTLPDPDHFKHSVVISIIIHGSSLAVLSLCTYGLWVAIALCGNVAHQFLFKLTQWPISSGMVLPAIQKFPITVGFLLVSMAYGSCGGLAIICAVLMYFILLSKMYEDYLEEFVFNTAAVITEKLFGGKKRSSSNGPPNRSDAPIPTPAIVEPKSGQSDSEKKEEEAGDTPEVQDSEKPKVKDDEKKVTKKAAKKVEFAVSDDDKNKTIDESSTSQEAMVVKPKSKLDIDEEGTVAKAGSQESFEVLYNQLDPDDVAMFSKRDEPEEMTEEEKKEVEKAEAELEKLISQMVERQKIDDEKRNAEQKIARAEYDDIPDGLSCIHFHMTLFLLLCVLALLNLPSVIVWARNYKYGEKILQHDPSYFPAIASIISLSVIWQLPTPRNV